MNKTSINRFIPASISAAGFAATLAAAPVHAQGINVSITAGPTKDTSSVSASGAISHIVTDADRKTFGIGDAPLKSAVAKFFGKKPNDVYVKSPTKWGDLYKTYSWPEVSTHLSVVDAQILEITSEPVILATKTLTNNSGVKATFTADIEDSVTNSATSSWNSSTTTTFSQSISYKVGIEGIGEAGGKTSFSFTDSYGEGGSHSSTASVSSGQGVSVSLDPGQSVEAVLNASRGTMKVRITYRVGLDGDVAVNYAPTYKKHHFWALNIGSVMQAAGISNNRTVTEDIEVGYFSNGAVTLQNPDGTVFMSN